MKGKVAFTPTGKGKSIVARVVIPKAFVELMKLTPNDRNVNITYNDGSVIITKEPIEKED